MANRYAVATGTWDASNTAIWSATSGGATGASVPTSADDVFLDAASGNITVTISGQRTAKSVNCTGFTGTLAKVNTYDGLALWGDLTLNSIMSFPVTTTGSNGGSFRFDANANITSGGHDLNWVFTQAGVTVTLQDNLLASYVIEFNGNGCGFNANGFNVTTNTFQTASWSGTVTMGSGLWTIKSALNNSGFFIANPATVNAGTSTLKFDLTSVGGASTLFIQTTGQSLYKVWATGSTDLYFNSSITCSNEFKVDSPIGIHGANDYVLAANSFNLSGGTYNDWIEITDNSTGTFSLSCSSNVTASFLKLTNILAIGGGTFTAQYSLDMGGNTGWVFSPGLPTSRYWVGTTANFNASVNDWAYITGGIGGAPIPTLDNEVFLDSNSGAGTITINGPTGQAYFKSLNCTGFAGTLFNDYYIHVYGDVVLSATMTYSAVSGTIRFHDVACNLTPGGQEIPYLEAYGGATVTLQGHLVQPTVYSYYYLDGSIFDANNYDVYCDEFDAYGAASVSEVRMGSGTWNIFDVLDFQTGTIVDAGTSTLVMTDDVGLGTGIRIIYAYGVAFNNITLASTHSAGLRIHGSNSFNHFEASSIHTQTIEFEVGTTTTVNSAHISGTVGNVKTIKTKSDLGTHSLVMSGATPQDGDYLNITSSLASPALSWYAGENSVDGGGNTGWIFSAAPSGPPPVIRRGGLFFAGSY